MKAYLAMALRTPEEQELVHKIEGILDTAGIEYYSPLTHGGLLSKDSTNEERVKIFLSNVEAVEQCDYVLACIDNFDAGVIFEMGYARGLGECCRADPFNTWHDSHWNASHNIKIITFSQVKGRGLNVMLQQAVIAFTDNLEDLPKLIRDPSLGKQWEGEVE